VSSEASRSVRQVRAAGASPRSLRRWRRVGQEHEYELELWHAHLDMLSEHDADAARHALQRFVEILSGLQGLPEEEPQA
jgi:hypothetical protein